MSRIILSVIAALSLAACVGGLPEPVEPPDFGRVIGDGPDDASFPLYAGRIDFVEEYVPPFTDPNVEHEFAAAPVDIARAWTANRLRAAGADGVVTVAVLEASTVETGLDLPDTVLSKVKDAPTRELKSTLKVTLTYEGDFGWKTVTKTVVGAVKINRYDSLQELEEEYYTLLADMADRFDELMSDAVATEFSGLTVLPGSGDGAEGQSDCIDAAVIDITAAGAVRLAGILVATGGLEAALEELTGRCDIATTLVVADEGAPGRLVAEAMSYARAAGLNPTLQRRGAGY